MRDREREGEREIKLVARSEKADRSLGRRRLIGHINRPVVLHLLRR